MSDLFFLSIEMTQEFYYDDDRNLIEWTPPTKKDSEDETQESIKTVDSNGVELFDGDSIVAIKWLPVKWWTDIKKGDIYKNIKLGDDPTHVSAKCKNNGKIFLKTEFFKKIA